MRGGRAGALGPAASGRLAVEAGRQLWHELPGLLGANLVFLAWCAPPAILALLGLPLAALLAAPLTVGPGAAGLLACVARLAHGEGAAFWRDSLRGARESFGAGAAHVAVVVLAWQAHALAWVAMIEGATWGTVGLWASQVSVAILAAMVEVHALPLVALRRQGAFEAARHALALSLAHPGETATVLALGGVAGTLAWALGGAPLVILPAVLAVYAVHNTRRLLGPPGAPEEWP